MCNIVKHLLMIVSLVCTLCTLLPSCIDDWTPMLPHDYSCYWNHHCNAHFINPNLKLPDMSCDTAYYNLQIAPYFPANSIHAIMPSSLFSPDSKCDFRWTATVYTKTCSSNTEQTQTIASHSHSSSGPWICCSFCQKPPSPGSSHGWLLLILPISARTSSFS